MDLKRVGGAYRVDICVRESFDFVFVFFNGFEIPVRVPAKELRHDRAGQFVAANIGDDCWLIAVGHIGGFKDCKQGSLIDYGGKIFAANGAPVVVAQVHFVGAPHALHGDKHVFSVELKSDVSGNLNCAEYFGGNGRLSSVARLFNVWQEICNCKRLRELCDFFEVHF